MLLHKKWQGTPQQEMCFHLSPTRKCFFYPGDEITSSPHLRVGKRTQTSQSSLERVLQGQLKREKPVSHLTSQADGQHFFFSWAFWKETRLPYWLHVKLTLGICIAKTKNPEPNGTQEWGQEKQTKQSAERFKRSQVSFCCIDWDLSLDVQWGENRC